MSVKCAVFLVLGLHLTKVGKMHKIVNWEKAVVARRGKGNFYSLYPQEILSIYSLSTV